MEPDGDRVVRVPELQAAVLDVVAGPDERSQSVVSVLQSLRAAGHDPEVDDVRSALRNLKNKGLVERIQRTVPTYRLTSERGEFEVEVLD
jgi:Fe2+ or Zn2+ uptake regulation protein